MAKLPDWTGCSVFSLASGPSMTAADAELVRHWRQAAPGRRVIVANTTFRLAPWADALFAMDRLWWDSYWQDVENVFRGGKFSSVALPVSYGALKVNEFNAYGNSGAGCISLAVKLGASRVFMLGYDCEHVNGKTHWHGSHPDNLGDALEVSKWPAKFEFLRRDIKADIFNASRNSALTCFDKVALESALEEECVES